MNLAKSWIVAAKDLRSFLRKRTVLYTVVVLPLMLSVLFPLIIEVSLHRSRGITAAGLPPLLNSFAFFFVIIPAIVPTPIASYCCGTRRACSPS